MTVNFDPCRVAQASSNQIANSQQSFRAKEVRDWLALPHPATGGQVLDTNGIPIKKLCDARSRFTENQLVTLIAAAGPNHCLDGWGFLARSASSLISRDSHAARHFAYYAQLRAALSILAASGIGIFNGLNFLTDSAGTILKLEDNRETKRGTGTHAVVWPALEIWASNDSNAEAFLSNVKVHGVPLLDSVRSIWPSRQASSIVAPLIHNWALDLTLGTQHHVQRNISSYAPHQLNQIDGDFKEDMGFIAQTWELLKPSSALGFDELDIHLLRNTLQMLHETDNAQVDAANAMPLGESAIASRFDELESTLKQAVSLEFLIANRSVDEPRIFTSARDNGSTSVSMISRAVLLLRAATSFTNATFAMGGRSVDGSDLRPWLDPVAVSRGFAAAASLPTQMSDLWDEVNYAVEDFQGVVSKNRMDAREFYNNAANGLPIVAQFERAALWSLCP
ncbi:hypothetical protein [Congregibacter litoralis]|uniref:Uncharacterized protein n=1 Tax=Congregibacter litoralis KT71 TaxID=314285 RepID=A4ABC7_9GAMM|nr:hypothetical protein [Congregibacter litoralis]EAQ96681.2 hypothetical protein KT71_06639 [Congregibacter litoralis KT71]